MRSKQGRRPWAAEAMDRFDHAEVFRLATERFPGMLAIIDGDGRAVYFNPSMLGYFGTDSEHVDGTRWFQFIHGDDRKAVVRTWRASRVHGRPLRMEVRILHPGSGSYRRFVMDGVPLGLASGSRDTWVVTCTDVEAVRVTEAALEDASAQLRSIFETSRSSLLLCEPDGTITALNPVAKERLRSLYGRVAKPGDVLWEVAPQTRRSVVHDGFQAALLGDPWEGEYAVTAPDGRRMWFHLSCVPVRRGNEIACVSLSAMDVTDRREAEEVRRTHDEILRSDRERVEASLRSMAAELEARVAMQTVELRREIAERKAMEADLDVLRQRLVEQGERERVALANGLHDDVLQEVLGLHLSVSNLVANPPESAGDVDLLVELDRMSAGLRGIAGSLRRTIRGLKPTALEELGLRSALESYIDGIESPERPAIVLDFDEVGRLDPALQLCLYRVGQESIRNAVKHAFADRVVASLRRDGDVLILHVSDDGVGFEVPDRISSLVRSDHFGLASIAEHVMAAGGSLDVRSSSEGGTVVEARFPGERFVRP